MKKASLGVEHSKTRNESGSWYDGKCFNLTIRDVSSEGGPDFSYVHMELNDKVRDVDLNCAVQINHFLAQIHQTGVSNLACFVM